MTLASLSYGDVRWSELGKKAGTYIEVASQVVGRQVLMPVRGAHACRADSPVVGELEENTRVI